MNISSLGLETLLPRIKTERLIRNVVRTATKALFPGYFFARFCPETALQSVQCARGLLRVVSSGKFPVPVDDYVVRSIQDRIGDEGFFRFCASGLRVGTRRLIQRGPFEGMIGRVERESDDRKRVTILLETLLNARVLIERRWLEPATA